MPARKMQEERLSYRTVCGATLAQVRMSASVRKGALLCHLLLDEFSTETY